MIEVVGDIFELAAHGHGLVIPTNGVVVGGANVMGKGVALQARRHMPGLPKSIAGHILRSGNVAGYFGQWAVRGGVVFVFTLPTKDDWASPSSLDLIRTEAQRLAWLAQEYLPPALGSKRKKVYLPHVGCGEGGLDWESQVKPMLLSVFGGDDRFVAVRRRE